MKYFFKRQEGGHPELHQYNVKILKMWIIIIILKIWTFQSKKETVRLNVLKNLAICWFQGLNLKQNSKDLL